MAGKTKLKVGIIGTGGIAHNHAGGYLNLPNECEIVALCDIVEGKAEAFAKEFKLEGVRFYNDCHEMMKKEKLDCVSVTTWNAAHKECTIAALEGGANVIVEKPMAMNAKEAEEMLAAAKKAGKILQVGFVRRFGADADTVNQFQKDNMLGDVYYAKAVYIRRDGCPGGWFKDKNFSGGGPVIDLGVHVIDLCRYLAGNPKPVSVYASTYNNLGPNRAGGGESAWSVADKQEHPYNVEDFACALIKFENGLTINMETSFNLNVKNDYIDLLLCGTKAGVQLSGDMEIYTTMAGRHVNIRPTGRTGFDFTGSFLAEMAGFIKTVRGEEKCRATGEDGLMLMKIIDAIYESSKTGKSVDLK
ncbi:MAG: Gfo/Idh/MocA family oxidoreductase [Clostridia bacterium]|nr:Gfo/Idh/MocA family oxidoreductase [Clostridia bacterium]